MHVCIFVCTEHGFNNGYKPFIFANKPFTSYKSLYKTLQIATYVQFVSDNFCFIEEILSTSDISIDGTRKITK